MRIMILLRRIRGIIPFMKDRSVKWWKKAIIIAALIYLVLPVDLIPPLIPVFGWLDDILIWAAILYFMGKELDKYVPGAKSSEKKYRYKDTEVQEVQFTVSEEEEANE